MVKNGQTVLTRDLDLTNGQAELTLTATPDLAGTLDFNAYLFGRDARPVGDHRLVFVQPADELKIEAAADAAVYKPGDEARIRFRVTNSRGEGVQAALGLQVVDEAVFALAEKQPGFAKVFFYLEQEVMKPRYEIHSIGMPDIVEPVEIAQAEQRDRAARALFAATEVVSGNKFETEVGRTVPQTKSAEYAARYQARFQARVQQLAESLTRAYRQNRNAGRSDEDRGEGGTARFMGHRAARGALGLGSATPILLVRSAGPDKRFDTADDLSAMLEVRTRKIAGPPISDEMSIDLQIEHDRGPFNGRAEVVGSVKDVTGAAVPGATITAREAATGTTRTATTNAAGQFTLAGLAAGDYQLRVSSPGFKIASRAVTLKVRDRAVLSAVLSVGAVTEAVVVEAVPNRINWRKRPRHGGVVGGVPGGVPGGHAVGGGFVHPRQFDAGALRAPPPPLPMMAEMAWRLARISTRRRSPRRNRWVRRAARALLLPGGALHQSGNHHRPRRPRQHRRFPWRTPSPPGAWRCWLPPRTARWAAAPSSLKVFQDFFVDLDLPVTLTQGDRVSIPVAAYNYSGARGDVSLQLQAGRLVRPGGRRSRQVPRGGIRPRRRVAVHAGGQAHREIQADAFRAHDGRREPRRHRGARDRSRSQRARAEPGLQRPPGKHGQARRDLPAHFHPRRQQDLRPPLPRPAEPGHRRHGQHPAHARRLL